MRKNSEFTLMMMVILMFSTVCMETDIYVPAFPVMKVFFNISDSQIQNVISYNFIGICLGSLIFGPISDSFGRRRTLIIGLVLFTISSWGCLIFSNFNLFLLCRFIQGIGAAVPMIASSAMLLDIYDTNKVAKLCGILNLFIAGAMAFSPMLGSVLILYYSWKANFMIIAVLASFSLLGCFLLLEETLSPDSRIKFSPKEIVRDYITMLKSFRYMAGNIVSFLTLAGVIVFIANLSLIFIEHLNVSQESYGFYQVSIMGSFAIVSAISSWMMTKYGTDTTKYIGLFFISVGAIAMILVAYYATNNPLLICSAMVLFTIGATLAMVIYCVDTFALFPDTKLQSKHKV